MNSCLSDSIATKSQTEWFQAVDTKLMISEISLLDKPSTSMLFSLARSISVRMGTLHISFSGICLYFTLLLTSCDENSSIVVSHNDAMFLRLFPYTDLRSLSYNFASILIVGLLQLFLPLWVKRSYGLIFKPPFWQLLFHMAAPLTIPPYHQIDQILKIWAGNMGKCKSYEGEDTPYPLHDPIVCHMKQ